MTTGIMPKELTDRMDLESLRQRLVGGRALRAKTDPAAGHALVDIEDWTVQRELTHSTPIRNGYRR